MMMLIMKRRRRGPPLFWPQTLSLQGAVYFSWSIQPAHSEVYDYVDYIFKSINKWNIMVMMMLLMLKWIPEAFWQLQYRWQRAKCRVQLLLSQLWSWTKLQESKIFQVRVTVTMMMMFIVVLNWEKTESAQSISRDNDHWAGQKEKSP